MERDIIQKIQELEDLTKDAKQLITFIITQKSKLENMVDLKSKSSLGISYFRKAIENLLDNDMLEWVPEKSFRKKAMYYGVRLLDMGERQVVKSYIVPLQSVRGARIVRSQTSGKHQPYYTTSIKGRKENFLKIYKTGKKIATAHLYRVATARYEDPIKPGK